MVRTFHMLVICIFWLSCSELPKVDAGESKNYMLQKDDSEIVFRDSSGNKISFEYKIDNNAPYSEFRNVQSNKALALTKTIANNYKGPSPLQLQTFTDFRYVNENIIDGLFITQNLTQCDEANYRVDFLFPNFDEVPELNHLQILHYEEQVKINQVEFNSVFVSPKKDLIFKAEEGLVAFLLCDGSFFVKE